MNRRGCICNLFTLQNIILVIIISIVILCDGETRLSENKNAKPRNRNSRGKGRVAAAVAKEKQETTEDAMQEFPTYNMIIKIENSTAERVNDMWELINKVTVQNRFNRTYINDVFWPEFLNLIREAHLKIREMDNTILFKRKPAALMDALFKVTSLKDLQKLAAVKEKSADDQLKLHYFKTSSAASQMHRFYSKRIRDILRDEPRIGMVALSIINYRGYTWGYNSAESLFGLTAYRTTPGLSEDNLLYMNNTKDIFTGIRELLQKNPSVVLKAQFDGKLCEDNETLFNMEPAGLEGPYYVLFYLCLSDIKFFLLYNFAYMYNHIFMGETFQLQAELRKEMRNLVQKKIDLFDNAFASFIKGTGPSYQNYPGVSTCDPPSILNRSNRNWKYEVSYTKLINFLKVFVSREQALHKAGNCKQTCDLLDATYKPCPHNDTSCILDEEIECLSKKKQCNAFNPPCPPGAYQCQNASSIVTTCPSTRYDRLYEYIKGYDFFFGPQDHECDNETTTLKGNWKIEQDVLVDTPHFCDVCTCYCFEPLKPLLGDFTVRYINLAYMNAKFKLNYIIVGIKFERIQDQIHLRIAEAQPLPNKKVNQSTIEWAPLKYQTNPAFLARLDRDLRSVNLDDVVTTDPDRVVTGVRFFSATYNGHVQYNYLGLQIITHPISEDGIIDKGTKTMKTGRTSRNANSTAHRSTYKYSDDPDGPDDPILAFGPSLPDTTSNQYIVFVGTSLVKDAAQSTIPYFDTQELIRKEPTWLKGIGLYHKSRPGFGGFLALKLIEYNDS